MSLLQISVRWVHLSASILLAALFLFERVAVAPFARKLPQTIQSPFLSLRRLTRRLAWWTWSIAQISWVAWLWLVTARMSGEDLIACINSDALSTVLFSTQFGHLWLMRLFIGVVFGISLYLPERIFRGRGVLDVSLAWLSCIELVSLAWVGHAVADPGPYGALHLLGDALHLLTSAFWPGALLPLATFFLLLVKSRQIRDLGLAAVVVRRFSTSSLTAVAVMALTGLSNSVFMVGSVQSLLTTDYGHLLISKLILFHLMVGFGAWNLLLLKPRLTVDVPGMNVVDQEGTIRSLFRNVLWEIGLGGAVILIVAVLGITSPPLH